MFDATRSDPSTIQAASIRPVIPMSTDTGMEMCMCAMIRTSPAEEP